MRGKLMKLLNLFVKKLHGCYDYRVDFNPDVTFIYGSNGCGKTTILNITEAIITGCLFKLFAYTFDEIQLKYASSFSNDENVILIQNSSPDRSLIVTFRNEQYVLQRIIPDSRRVPDRETRLYFEHYDFLQNISKLFNYVYLPLNRASAVGGRFDREYFQARRDRDHIIIDDGQLIKDETTDSAIRQIESLISQRCSIINAQLARISDSFRNNVLKSVLVTNSDVNTDELFKTILLNPNIINQLQETKEKYIKVLTDIELITEQEAAKHGAFFDSLVEAYNGFKNKKQTDPLGFLVKLSEIERINKMVAMAEEVEHKKADIRKPINLFLNTMNSFVYNDDDGKEIKIDATGKIYFTTKYSSKHISIQNLSSGEKQLLTFFANLIFSVKSNSPGIFVVDEPELSLHLSWQQVFVDKTLDINKNIQLIFATHAPEIIGHRRNKMYKLEKKFSD